MVFANRSLRTLTGLMAETWPMAGWMSRLVEVRHHERIRREFERVLAGGGQRDWECPIQTSAGGARNIVWRTELWRDAERARGVLAFGIALGEEVLSVRALRESEARHRAIFELTPEPMWVYDCTTLGFLQVNAAAIRAYGYSREEFSTMTVRDIRPSKDVAAFEQMIHRQAEQSSRLGIWRHHRKDGSEIDVEVSSRAIRCHGREARLVLAVDVTAQTRMNEALRESESLLRSLFESSMDAVVLSSQAGEVLAANPAACRLFACPEGELRRLDCNALLDPTDPRGKKLMEARPPSGHAQGEMRFLRRDGSAFEAELTHAVFTAESGELRTSMIIRDITSRKRADEARRRSEERLQLAIAAARLATWEIDLATGEMVLSGAYAEWIGCAPTELPRTVQAYREQVHPADRDRFTRLFAEAVEGTHAYEAEYRMLTKQGRPCWLAASGRVLRNEQNQSPGMLGISLDITARKQAEALVRENSERLQLFVEYAPAALAMFDVEMRYLSVSRRWRIDYGLGDTDVIGRCHYDVFPEIDDRWKMLHRRALAGEVLRSDNDHFVRIDGHTQWLRWELRPWHNAEGAVGGIVIFSEDITARREAELAALARYEELRRWHDATLGRETRVLELKHEVNELLAIQGKAPRYPSALDEPAFSAPSGGPKT